MMTQNEVFEPLIAMCFMLCSRAWPLCCAIWIGLSAGNASPAALPSGVFEVSTATHPGHQADLKQRQIAFLNRIRKSDPQHRTIERALFTLTFHKITPGE